MRKLSVITVLALLIAAGFTLNTTAGVSNTFIGAGKTFMLGGQQNRAITLEGRNIGNTDIEVLLLADGNEQSIAIVKPEKSFSLELPARNTALFRNHASRTASVKLKLTNAVSQLSMGYENGDDGL